MSPVAPSRSSFDAVPSSWTVTFRPAAQAENASTLPAFVTTWTSSIPGTASTPSRIQSMIGRPPTGSSSFGSSSVSGLSRVP